MEITEILRHGIVTEKSVRLMEKNQYTFKVALKANKIDIQRAVEQLFGVHVVSVNTMRMPGKSRRIGGRRGSLPRNVEAREWKKAIVTIREGETIEALKA